MGHNQKVVIGRHGRFKIGPEEALRNFAEHGIVAVHQGRTGEILRVKTATMGWMKPQEYAFLKEIKDAYPLIAQIVRSGYELKAWLYGSSVTIQADVFATGGEIQLPLGAILVTIVGADAAVNWALGNKTAAMLDILALVLPFGELWLLYHFAQEFVNFITGNLPGGVDSQKLPFVGGITNPLNIAYAENTATYDAVNNALGSGVKSVVDQAKSWLGKL